MEAQLGFKFDVWPDHGGRRDNQVSKYQPMITWATSPAALVDAGFEEIEGEMDGGAGRERGAWKRVDSMGRSVEISWDGHRKAFVKHRYVHHKLDNSCFELDHNYASALYMGRDNAFLFYNFGPTERTEEEVLSGLFASMEDK